MSPENPAKIALTFDLEFWHCGIYLKKYLTNECLAEPDIYPRVVQNILNLLDEYNIKATFFVLGKLAESSPQLIKQIYLAGHEIALHGYNHQPLNGITATAFEHDLIKTKKIISDIIGVEPLGFRAPNFIMPDWLVEKLAKNNLKYDSSVYPLVNKSTNIKLNQSFRLNAKYDVIEFPIAVYNLLGIKIPISGGWYFRVMPLKFFNFFLKKILKQDQLAVLYFHPMDMENFIPKLKMPLWLKIIKYWGVRTSFAKFKKFVELNKNCQFITLKEFYEKNINHHPGL